MGYFKQYYLYVQNVLTTFSVVLEKIGELFIPFSGHTGRCNVKKTLISIARTGLWKAFERYNLM